MIFYFCFLGMRKSKTTAARIPMADKHMRPQRFRDQNKSNNIIKIPIVKAEII